MSVIRFNVDDVFTTDSQEYEILANAAYAIKGVNGAVVEIGTRRGGSAKLIIDVLAHNQDTNRSMFCIDPYGNIEYACTNKNITAHNLTSSIQGDPMSTENTGLVRLDYDNHMRNRIVPSLYYYAFQNGLNFQFFFLEDTEFFNRYSDGVPVYDYQKTRVNEYALVFFDGPHTNEAVQKEIEFFEPRMPNGAVMVFDDIWMMDHDRVVEEYIFQRGWKLLEKKQIKASYIKKIG